MAARDAVTRLPSEATVSAFRVRFERIDQAQMRIREKEDALAERESRTLRALDVQTSGIYNLGSGQARSFNELVDVLNKCLGTNFKPDYIDNPHVHYQNFTQANLANARSALKYEPRFPLEDGVRDYMQWLYG